MRSQIEGSQAVARAVALCRPEVVSAYPISPQTHIVEALSDLVRTGALHPCEYLMVESEFGALSAAIGASAAGARTYTATASQGLLYMAEALYNASGLGLPIVMTLANRAIGAPINIWNDHSDVMSQRDCGWIQLFAESNQEAVDLHVQAFALAEELAPGDGEHGRLRTHPRRRAGRPADAGRGRRVPPRVRAEAGARPGRPGDDRRHGGPGGVHRGQGPDARKQMQALDVVPRIAAEFAEAFGRSLGGLVRTYPGADAETVVVALGSVLGTIDEVVDELRGEGVDVGSLGVRCFRPYPLEEIREALSGARRVIVLERAFAVGVGGIVGQNVRLALAGLPIPVYDVVAGLGGRAITKRSLRALLTDVLEERIEPHRLTFLDLNRDLLDRELERIAESRKSGPHAENILRDVGAVAAGPH